MLMYSAESCNALFHNLKLVDVMLVCRVPSQRGVLGCKFVGRV